MSSSDLPRATIRKRAQRAIPLGGRACQRCGSTTNTQRHHPDYALPEVVEILCQVCHTALERARGTWGKGQVRPARCRVCDREFLPATNRNSRLCGSQECRREMGRRSAAVRWRTA